ncbi:MAG: hypothetical protein IT260_09760, partial [Saprospiraceae bacterium]|nr:hypothetical protein [Saprospiraceae bacterium]
MFIRSDNITSPLGWTTHQHFEALRQGRSGLRLQERPDWTATPFWAALFDSTALDEAFETRLQPHAGRHWTRFEKMVLLSLSDALQHSPVRLDDPDTIFILSSTKGNVALLEQQSASHPDLRLAHTAAKIAAHWAAPNRPLVVSQACISGLAAILLAKRLLDHGRYRHAVVCGADEISRFIWSGFQSFQALSDEPCRPFDSRRKGLNLGEGCATLIFSATAPDTPGVRVSGAAISNDANHISGPSRSGAELSQAIGQALEQARWNAGEVDFISAHGTATPYNDEMEAKA